MSNTKPSVAFLGLGKMGLAMAANIQRAGFPLTVWNRSLEKADTLKNNGAQVAASPQAASARADIVISSLANDASVESVTLGGEGILKGLRKGGIHVGTSTISPKLADRLAEMHAAHGSVYVSGPVLGRVPAAEAGQLMTFVAGPDGAIEIARPVIASYAPAVLPAGEQASQASTAKLIANFLGVAGMDLIGQAMAMGERTGVSPFLVRQMLMGFFAAEATRDYVGKIADHDFDNVGFTASGGLKDVELMLQAASAAGVDLSSARTIRDKLVAAIDRGWQDKDWSCFTDIDRLR